MTRKSTKAAPPPVVDEGETVAMFPELADADLPRIGEAEVAEQVEAEGDAPLGRPWTLKGIVPETRTAATISAARARIGVAQWVARAVHAQAALEAQAGKRVAVVPPPGLPVVQAAAEVAVMASSPAASADPEATLLAARETAPDMLQEGAPLREVAALIQMCGTLAAASGGVLPKTLQGAAAAVLRQRLRDALRG